MRIEIENRCDDCPDGCDYGDVKSYIESETVSYFDKKRDMVTRKTVIYCEHEEVCKFKGTDSYQ